MISLSALVTVWPFPIITVAAILYLRGNQVKVEIDCPPNLYVMTDRLRLKQVVLNLAMNSSKFVEQGFIRIRAAVTDDNEVQLHLEDSGRKCKLRIVKVEKSNTVPVRTSNSQE